MNKLQGREHRKRKNFLQVKTELGDIQTQHLNPDWNKSIVKKKKKKKTYEISGEILTVTFFVH